MERLCLWDHKPVPAKEGPGRPNEYCSPECRDAAQKDSQNLRQALSRAGIRRREFIKGGLVFVLGSRIPINLPRETVRRDEDWEEIARLRSLLSGSEPFHVIRQQVLGRVLPMCTRLESVADKNEDASRLLFSCREVLRDVGEVGRPAQGYQKLLQLSDGIAQYWLGKKEMVRYAWAVLARVNILRALEDWGGAPVGDRHLLALLNVVDSAPDRLDPTDREVLILRHQIHLWRVRLFCGAGDMGRAGKELDKLKKCAEQIDSPVPWLDYHRETVGYFNRRGDFYKAEEQLEVLDQHVASMPAQPSLSELTVIRPRVEYLFAKDRPSATEEAVHLVKQEYLRHYAKWPSSYYENVIHRWNKKYRLGLQVPRAQVTDATLVHRYLVSKV